MAESTAELNCERTGNETGSARADPSSWNREARDGSCPAGCAGWKPLRRADTQRRRRRLLRRAGVRPPSTDPRRSALMARVRQKGTRAELAVASLLRSLGPSYRLNVRSLPGWPDLVNKPRQWAVVVPEGLVHDIQACKAANRETRGTAG